MTQQLTPVTGDAFRPEGQRVQLPSQQGTDQCVILRRPDLVDLIAGGEGEVPDVLTNLVLGMLNKRGERQTVDINAETLPQIMKSLNAVAIASFEQPKLWANDRADGDYVPVAWIPFNDKAFVFAWALGGQYHAAQSFRSEPNGHAGVVPALREVPPQTE